MASSPVPKAPEPKALLRGHRSAVSCVSFLYGGTEYLVSGDVDGDLLIWSLATKRVFKPLLESHLGGVLSVSASDHDRRWLSQGRTDGSIKIWQGTELVDVVRTESESFCRAAVVWGESFGDILLACTTRDEAVIAVWKANDVANRKLFGPREGSKWGMAMEVKLVRMNETMFAIVVYEDGCLRVFDVTNQENLDGMTITVQPAQSPATSVVVAGTVDSEFGVKGLAGGASTELCSFSLDFKNRVASTTAFFPAFEKIPSTSSDAEEGTRLGKGVGQLSLRRDARICAIASWDHRLRIVHFRTCRHLAVLKHHRGSVQAVCFSADSSLLASGSKDQNIALWSIYTNQS